METMNSRRSYTDVLQAVRDPGCKPQILYPAKFSITITGESKIFTTKPDLNNTYPEIQLYRKY